LHICLPCRRSRVRVPSAALGEVPARPPMTSADRAGLWGRTPPTHRLETAVTTPAHPGRMLFVTMPVADVEPSKASFPKLGFSFDGKLRGETAGCMLIGDQASVMLSSRETFAQYSHLPMGDPATHALALYSFSVAARDDVDTVTETALAAGATEADGPEDHG